jgi:hypothetical protein
MSEDTPWLGQEPPEPDHAVVTRNPDGKFSVVWGDRTFWVYDRLRIKDKSSLPKPHISVEGDIPYVMPARRKWELSFDTGPAMGTTLLVSSFDYVDNYDNRNKGLPWVQKVE